LPLGRLARADDVNLFAAVLEGLRHGMPQPSVVLDELREELEKSSDHLEESRDHREEL
jgi:hypothetical protein